MLTLLAQNHAPRLKPFVPRGFEVPRRALLGDFRLQALTLDYAEGLFSEMHSSSEHLQSLFGAGWPTGLDMAQHRVDLAWHQKEFERRTSFAYVVLGPLDDAPLGCVYIDPCERTAFDADVRYWIRRCDVASGMQEKLGMMLADWMEDVWPFINPRYRPRLRSPGVRLH